MDEESHWDRGLLRLLDVCYPLLIACWDLSAPQSPDFSSCMLFNETFNYDWETTDKVACREAF